MPAEPPLQASPISITQPKRCSTAQQRRTPKCHHRAQRSVRPSSASPQANGRGGHFRHPGRWWQPCVTPYFADLGVGDMRGQPSLQYTSPPRRRWQAVSLPIAHAAPPPRSRPARAATSHRKPQRGVPDHNDLALTQLCRDRVIDRENACQRYAPSPHNRKYSVKIRLNRQNCRNLHAPRPAAPYLCKQKCLLAPLALLALSKSK